MQKSKHIFRAQRGWKSDTSCSHGTKNENKSSGMLRHVVWLSFRGVYCLRRQGVEELVWDVGTVVKVTLSVVRRQNEELLEVKACALQTLIY
jgi:hypothetical protein